MLRPDSPPPITRPGPGATDLWPFKYYQPGSWEAGYGDWDRGNDLKDCEMLAKERYGWREARGLRKKVPGACLPGGLPVVGVYIELLHVWWLGEYDRRAAESKLVLELDIWACYCTWDPNGAQSRFPLIDL